MNENTRKVCFIADRRSVTAALTRYQHYVIRDCLFAHAAT